MLTDERLRQDEEIAKASLLTTGEIWYSAAALDLACEEDCVYVAHMHPAHTLELTAEIRRLRGLLDASVGPTSGHKIDIGLLDESAGGDT